MPTIEISDATWKRLQELAVPFEEKPEDVIIRILKIAEKSKPKIPGNVAGGEPPRGGDNSKHRKLPQKEFRVPLLKALYEEGGSATTKKMRKVMESRMASRLSEADYKHVSGGALRWRNAICWERNELVKEGFLRGDSQYGTWQLSERGVKFVEAMKD